MAMQDLFQALQMFGDGVKQLQTQRAITNANDQVQQIKASEGNEADKRAQLQSISNGLVAHLAGMGTPATTLQTLQGVMGPKQYANANQMNADALLTGNKQLADAASDQQDFENDKAFELAKMKLQAKMMNNSPFAQEKLNEAIDEHTQKLNESYGKSLDAAQASSRSQFGQWAAVQGRGDRIQGIIGNPNRPMTEQELAVARDSLLQMVKNGVPTADEMKQMQPMMAKIEGARAQSAISGKPTPVDLSGWANLFSGMAQREDQVAKQNMLDTILQRANNGAKLAGRPNNSDQYKLMTAKALGQVGIAVDPNTITIDPKKGVQIPEIQQYMDAADKAPAAVRQAFVDAKNGKPEATQFLQSYGVTPDMGVSEAIKHVRRQIKSKAFQ